MALGDCEHYAELAPEENKRKYPRKNTISKPAKVVSPSKNSPSPGLVNRSLLFPIGANRWYRLYDPALCEVVPDLYEGGKSDAEVAVAIGIAKSTFYDWCNQYPEFKAAVNFGKTMGESAFQSVGREASFGEREINGQVWAANMRNRYGYDPRPNTEKTPDTDEDKEASILKATQEKLIETTSDY